MPSRLCDNLHKMNGRENKVTKAEGKNIGSFKKVLRIGSISVRKIYILMNLYYQFGLNYSVHDRKQALGHTDWKLTFTAFSYQKFSSFVFITVFDTIFTRLL